MGRAFYKPVKEWGGRSLCVSTLTIKERPCTLTVTHCHKSTEVFDTQQQINGAVGLGSSYSGSTHTLNSMVKLVSVVH